MALFESSDRSDVVETAIVHGVLAVGLTAVEIKVGGSRLSGRQIVTIFNESNSKQMFWGGTGVTNSGASRGIPIEPNQILSLPVGDLAVFVVGETAGLSAVVAEIA